MTCGKILLKKEYRYACGMEVIEFSARMFNPDEKDPLAVAKRELLEETGYSSDSWEYLGGTWESTSKLTNTMHLFLAKDCAKASEQHLDQNEHLEVVKVPLQEAAAMGINGDISSNSSAHLILRVERMMGI